MLLLQAVILLHLLSAKRFKLCYETSLILLRKKGQKGIIKSLQQVLVLSTLDLCSFPSMILGVSFLALTLRHDVFSKPNSFCFVEDRILTEPQNILDTISKLAVTQKHMVCIRICVLMGSRPMAYILHSLLIYRDHLMKSGPLNLV